MLKGSLKNAAKTKPPTATKSSTLAGKSSNASAKAKKAVDQTAAVKGASKKADAAINQNISSKKKSALPEAAATDKTGFTVAKEGGLKKGAAALTKQPPLSKKDAGSAGSAGSAAKGLPKIQAVPSVASPSPPPEPDLKASPTESFIMRNVETVSNTKDPKDKGKAPIPSTMNTRRKRVLELPRLPVGGGQFAQYLRPGACPCWGLGGNFHSPFFIPAHHARRDYVPLPRNTVQCNNAIFPTPPKSVFRGFGVCGAGDACGGLRAAAQANVTTTLGFAGGLAALDELDRLSPEDQTALLARTGGLQSGLTGVQLGLINGALQPSDQILLTSGGPGAGAGGATGVQGGFGGAFSTSLAQRSANAAASSLQGISTGIGTGGLSTGGLGQGTGGGGGVGIGGGGVRIGGGGVGIGGGGGGGGGVIGGSGGGASGLQSGLGGVTAGSLGGLAGGGGASVANMGALGGGHGALLQSGAAMASALGSSMGGAMGAMGGMSTMSGVSGMGGMGGGMGAGGEGAGVGGGGGGGAGSFAAAAYAPRPMAMDPMQAALMGALMGGGEGDEGAELTAMQQKASAKAVRKRMRLLVKLEEAVRTGKISVTQLQDALVAIGAAPSSGGPGPPGLGEGTGGPEKGKLVMPAKKDEGKDKGKGKVPDKAKPKAGKPVKKPVIKPSAAKAGPAKSKKRLKKLAWDPLNKKEKTIYEGLPSEPPVEVKEAQVEEDFDASPKKAVEGPPKAKKERFLTCLPDPKRSYQMALATSRLVKMGYERLQQAVLTLDPELITANIAQTLINNAPTKEEILSVKDFIKSGQDVEKLDKPEKFVMSLMDVPDIKDRLTAHLYALEFADALLSLSRPAELVSRACEALRESTRFPTCLRLIVKLGNALNSTEVAGIKFSSLSKIAELRTTTKPQRSFLQYLIDQVWATPARDALLIEEELKPVEGAIQSKFSQAVDTLKELKKGFTSIAAAVDRMVQAGDIHVEKQLSAFIREAERQLREAEEALATARKQFDDICLFYGENPADVPNLTPESWLRMPWFFAKNLSALLEEKRLKLKKEEKRRRDAEAKANQAKASGVPGTPGAEGGGEKAAGKAGAKTAPLKLRTADPSETAAVKDNARLKSATMTTAMDQVSALL